MSARNFGITLLLLTSWLAPAAGAQFETRSSFYLGAQSPYSLVVGDFDRDGILDVAVPGISGGNVEILLGNGDGTFRHGMTYAVAPAFHAAAASLRHNGILDLVVAGAGTDDVYVLLGNGDGTFQSAVPYPTTAQSYMVVIGSFTGSGNLDILNLEGTTSQGEVCDCVEVLPGDGDGTFGTPITTTLPYTMTGYAMAIGDFNLDGRTDIAVGGEEFPNYQVAILLGNGNGTFTADGYYLVPGAPSAVAGGYLTSSKARIDLAVSNGAQFPYCWETGTEHSSSR